jgi:protoporphyrinogen oxidase
VYLYQRSNIRLGRVTNFANWSEDMLPNSHHTPLCCEYWCDFGDSTWQQSEAEILVQAEQDLRTIGLLPEAKVSGGFVVKLARTHPIYAVNYQEALSEVNDYLNQFENLDIIGRYGAFKYHDQDGSLYMGILAAENAVSKSGVS